MRLVPGLVVTGDELMFKRLWVQIPAKKLISQGK